MTLKAVASESLSASGITIGSSVITGGTDTRVLFDDAGVVGESAGLTYVKGTGLLTATRLSVSSTIIDTSGNITGNNNINIPAAAFYYWTGRVAFASPADATLRVLSTSQLNSFTLSAPTATATPTLQFGAIDAAVAVAQTLRVQSVISGTAAANGANLTIIGSLPTGTGTSGDIIIQTGVKTGSGTTQGTATTALTIKGETQAITIASGKSLVLGNSASTGLAAGVLAALTNASIVITDASGQAYRIPCII